MAADGDTDYGAYTDAELDAARANAAPDEMPLNHARLLAEIERRRAARQADTPPPPRRYEFEFRATGSEYFRIWIVNLALTIVTVGIYSAWAKVRKLRYFYGNTLLDGSPFGYHGEPIKILKGRLIAAGLGVVYFGLRRLSPAAGALGLLVIVAAVPWLIVRSRMFSLGVTSWRGLRFGFRSDYAGAYRTIIGWGAATAVTLGLLYPRFACERARFIVSRSRLGREEFACAARVGRFYKTVLAAGGIGLLVFVTAAFGAGFVLGLLRPDPSPAVKQLVPLAAVVLVYATFIPLAAYVHARNANEIFNTTTLGPHSFDSRLRARSLAALYLTNVLGVIFTLGLFTPWAQLRLARYRLATLADNAAAPLEALVADPGAAVAGAAGEQISEVFDVDFGL